MEEEEDKKKSEYEEGRRKNEFREFAAFVFQEKSFHVRDVEHEMSFLEHETTFSRIRVSPGDRTKLSVRWAPGTRPEVALIVPQLEHDDRKTSGPGVFYWYVTRPAQPRSVSPCLPVCRFLLSLLNMHESSDCCLVTAAFRVIMETTNSV